MARWRLPPNALALAATCLLLFMVTGRAAVKLLAPDPVRASDVLGTEATRFPRGRIIVLADSTDRVRVREAEAVVRRTGSDLPLEIWILGPDDQVRRQQLRKLVRAYGFDDLPVLLTLDAEVRVLRAEPL